MTPHRLLAPRDFRRMPWKNGAGRTAEIAAWSPDTGDAGFAWRVSIAEIERAAVARMREQGALGAGADEVVAS